MIDEPLDTDDARVVLRVAFEAGESGDDPRLLWLFDVASKQLSKQSISNVLIGTNWSGQVTMRRMLGWPPVEPSATLIARRAAYVAIASEWLATNHPGDRLGILSGLDGNP